MSRFNARNTAGMLALALGGLVVSSTSFAAQPLAQGHVAKANHATAEGKCGEGKCGDATFGKTDGDHDGRVSRAELTAVAPGVDFSKIDRDGDGFVSEMEAYKNLKAIFAANGKSIPAGLFAKIK
jgi:uncharacterized low-complexity protein